MLRKLMKHEFRATAKILVPLFAAVIAMLGGAQAIFLVIRLSIGRQELPGAHPLVTGLAVLLCVLSFLALIVLLAVLVVVAVQRFYQNLLGDEGYVMFTLPATPAQQILSKLLVSLIWSLAGLTVCALAAGLVLWDLSAVRVANVSAIPDIFRTETGMNLSIFIVGLVIFILLAFANTYLNFYLCIAIGGQWPQNRLLASAAAYLILNMALQFFMLFGTIAAALLLHFSGVGLNSLQSLAARSPGVFAFGVFGLIAALMTALSLAYFFVTRWLLGRRLNLA